MDVFILVYSIIQIIHKQIKKIFINQILNNKKMEEKEGHENNCNISALHKY